MLHPTRLSSFSLVSPSKGTLGQSCVGRCGVNDGVSGCQCNSVCSNYGDCCSDYEAVCFSCKDRCGEGYVQSKPCQCNNECGSHGNCCSDYDVECGGEGLGSLRLLSSLKESIFLKNTLHIAINANTNWSSLSRRRNRRRSDGH